MKSIRFGRRLTEIGNKIKIEASVLLGDEDEEVEVHGKPNLAILAEGDAGLPVAEVCRKHGISNALYYQWKVSDP